MKILAIRIRNLASIDGLTEIDFTSEPLCSAGIFAITGITGAGKSTILDALCLALYAETPRYKNAEGRIELRDVGNNTIAQNDVRGILRDGTGDGFAEVDFVGVDNKKYRSQWAVKRARGKINGAIQTETMTIKSLDTDQVITARKSEAYDVIERLVGLNYEQFTRSVLLAQGDFTAFLKADKDAKASLLEKLTGTNIYSKISQRVYENYKSAHAQSATLKAQLENIELLKEEELQHVNNQVEQVTQKLTQLDRELKQLNAGLQWHEQERSLNIQLQSANEILEQARQQLENASGIVETVFLAEQVQQVKPIAQGIETIRQELEEHQSTLERLKSEATAESTSLEAIQQAVKEQEEQLASARMQQSKASPMLQEAFRLDMVLVEKKQQLRVCMTDWKDADDLVKKVKADHQEKAKVLSDLESTITRLEEWQEKNADRKPIAENFELIRAKLEDAQKLLDQIAARTKEEELTRGKICLADKNLSGLKVELDEATRNLEKLKSQLLHTKSRLADEGFSQLEERKKSCDEIVSELIQASATWTVLFAELNSRELYQQQYDELKDSIGKRSDELVQLKMQIPLLAEKKTASARRLEKTKLELAKDVAALRQLLTNGESCPVCGSTEHPYAKHFPSFDNTIGLLEEEAALDEKTWQEALNNQYNAAGFIQTSNDLLPELKAKIDRSCNNITQLQSKWEGYSVYKDCSSIDKNEVEQWLTQYTNEQQVKQAAVGRNMEEFNTLKKLFDDQSSQKTSAETQLAVQQHAIELASSEIKSRGLQLTSLTDQRKELEVSLSKITDRLNPFFTNPQWIQNWQQEPVRFMSQIEKFRFDWHENRQTLEADRSQLSVLRNGLEHSATHILQLQLELTKKENGLNEVKEQVGKLKESRLAIFNGKPVNEVEEDLSKTVAACEETLGKSRQQASDITLKLTSLKTKIDHSSQMAVKSRATLGKNESEIQQWISAFNQKHSQQLSSERLSQLLKYDHEWIDQQRKSLQLLRDKVVQSETSCRDLRLRIEQHQSIKPTDQLLEELQIQHGNCLAQLESSKTELNQYQFRLRLDKDNQRKAGKYLKELQEQSAITDRWGKLNDMIGSADGKKFRQVAQEYTLEVLLGFANVHLSALTRRYELQRIPDTLGLQVIDHDMGDEIRTVYSLSGGESFLVSLALALGLASLSSNNIKVESLFIDEGFGSLDPGTLNVVMDALERLHNQGRKVGVISHVQEMKERIMTQIKVTKQSSGKSVIAIGNGLD